MKYFSLGSLGGSFYFETTKHIKCRNFTKDWLSNTTLQQVPKVLLPFDRSVPKEVCGFLSSLSLQIAAFCSLAARWRLLGNKLKLPRASFRHRREGRSWKMCCFSLKSLLGRSGAVAGGEKEERFHRPIRPTGERTT